MFKIYDAQVGITYNEVNYQITDADGVTFNYPEMHHLMRGATGKNTDGVIWEEGKKEANTAELTVVNCSAQLYNLLNRIFDNKDRIKFWVIDEKTGDSITFDRAIIQRKPAQMSIGEDSSSHSFVLAIESYKDKTKIKEDK